MITIRSRHAVAAISLVAMSVIFCRLAGAASCEKPVADASLLASLCPVVYPLDQFPTKRGYRYFFFGNAFFINENGYLITAAHVVDSFRGGGQPYILVAGPDGSRRLQKAELVGEDRVHDVAILRAIPNPFEGPHQVAFVPLTVEQPSPGKSVVTLSLFPCEAPDSYTSEFPVEKRTQGRVIGYKFYTETEGVESQLLLFNQKVVPGQSGSPVLSADSRAVVGIVVGQWLHPVIIHLAATALTQATLPGAALRIHYAIALLRLKGISWHTASPATASLDDPTPQGRHFTPPVPISLVATPYPPEALFGGEVVLDALIDKEGRIAHLNVVHGSAPFLEPVLDAVRTWTFSPAQKDGRPVEARTGIVFQFSQSFLPKLTSGVHTFAPPPKNIASHGALPLVTVEPAYPPNTVAEDNVILYDLIDAQGQVTSTRVLNGVEPLAATTLKASQQWQFTPAKMAGVNTDSSIVLVVTFRHP